MTLKRYDGWEIEQDVDGSYVHFDELLKYHRAIGEAFTAASQTPFGICKTIWKLHAAMEAEIAIASGNQHDI